MALSDRVRLPSGETTFLAGFNLAWIDFANDVGDVPLDESAFASAMRDVASVGGNVLRVWLSTNGANDPRFGVDGLVCGLGSRTVGNVRRMLELARENGLLLMPVLLTHNFLQEQGQNLSQTRAMLATDAGLDAYLRLALVPLVTAIGHHPNLLCWEIANEAEGMVEGIGWTDQRITQVDVQRLTNRMAGAIHRAVPGLPVSTGTVQASYLSWYDDAALRSAGGDPDGTLDFHMIHYYGWNGPENSPFRHPASHWGVDKPIVVGEFASSSWSPSTPSSNPLRDGESVDLLLETLLANGYAGGLFWQYQRDGGDPWMRGFRDAAPSLVRFAKDHPEALVFTPRS